MSKIARCLLIVVNDPMFFLSHRLPIALAALNSGYRVHVATAAGEGSEQISKHGLIHHVIPLSRSGNNPFQEIVSICSIWRIVRKLKPDIVHLVTIKPVLYGGIAARLAKVPGVVAAISGLGSVFVARGFRAGLLRALVKRMYRLILRHPNLYLIFQNPDDREVLSGIGLLNTDRSVLIRGSGVSIEDYPLKPEPDGDPVVAFASRLLKEKGVCEFIKAARLLNHRGVRARFWVIGKSDPGNPASITEEEIKALSRENIVEFLGYRNDIPDLFSEVNIVTLPSYYGEGLPKVLLEAAASGRAVITTDHPGCRDAIESGRTGLLVPVRDHIALADAIEHLLKDSELRLNMGRAGRELAQKEFAIEKVINAHMNVYQSLLREKRDSDGR